MNEAEKYFLVVAEELNISKAAQRLFVSHQNISQHIQNLEEKYGTQLIIRKPKMMLTPAGRDLADTLAHVKVLEDQMLLRLRENDPGYHAELSFGMPHSRAFMLVAPIVEQFWTRYPNVKLSFIEAGSAELAQKVLRSELDMYMGVRNNYSPKLTHELLLKEDLYLVIPDTLLKQKFPQDYRERLTEFSMGVDIAQFQGIPFSMAAPGSFLRNQIDDFLSQEQVELDIAFETKSHETQLIFGQRGIMAFFCTQMHLYIIQQNNMSSASVKMHVFPLNRSQIANTLYLIYHKDGYFPQYKLFMRNTISEVVRKFELLDSGDFISFGF